MTRHTALTMLTFFVLSTCTVAFFADAARSRHALAETRAASVFTEALLATPFSASITIEETNPSLRSLVVRMFNTKLGQEAYFVGTLTSGGGIYMYEPTYYNDIITTIGSPQRIALRDVPKGTRGIATMFFDDEGRLQISRIVIGAGSWDR